MAVEARDFGFCVTPVSREAWLRPKAFDLAAPTFRQLRRKLRKSQKAGIEIRDLEHRADLHTTLQKMAIVAKEWAELHGGERGFTMGTFDPYYVQTQRCFLAYQNEELVGFATFSMVKAEWVLDLMRHTEHMPDGTMHSLVAHAIQCAATENLPRLSLAAVPWTPTKEISRIARWFWQTLYKASGGAGLAQFKASFAPQWETLYMAAPSRLGLALGAFDVTRAIVTPSKTGTISPNYLDNAKNSLKQVI
jgi:phosphatidylglycerol lysyltransferase